MALPEGLQPQPDEQKERSKFNDALGELPLGDIPYLQELAKWYSENRELPLRHFFSRAIVPYYDPMWDGLKIDAGHIIYRLSDVIPPEERATMEIYPSNTGSIIQLEDNTCPRWDSLEDWRTHWKRHHPIIPEYRKKLPGNSS